MNKTNDINSDEEQNKLMASSDTRIESATLKRKLALEKMHEIEKNIEETETVRAERDKYWNDLISKETEKRSKCRRGRPRKLSTNVKLLLVIKFSKK
ncbi:unnamed protein product [Rotaria socialis]